MSKNLRSEYTNDVKKRGKLAYPIGRITGMQPQVNTGCREQEVCQLRGDLEVKLPELETRVFGLPSNDVFQTKNSQERISHTIRHAKRKSP